MDKRLEELYQRGQYTGSLTVEEIAHYLKDRAGLSKKAKGTELFKKYCKLIRDSKVKFGEF